MGRLENGGTAVPVYCVSRGRAGCCRVQVVPLEGSFAARRRPPAAGQDCCGLRTERLGAVDCAGAAAVCVGGRDEARNHGGRRETEAAKTSGRRGTEVGGRRLPASSDRESGGECLRTGTTRQLAGLWLGQRTRGRWRGNVWRRWI